MKKQTRQRPQIRGFYDECWKANVWLVWAVNSKQLSRIVKKELGQDYMPENESWAGKCLSMDSKLQKGGHAVVIALREWSLEPGHISTLAHECFHAAEYILQGRVEHNPDTTSEVFAYLTDSIVRRCLRLLAGQNPNTIWDCDQ